MCGQATMTNSKQDGDLKDGQVTLSGSCLCGGITFSVSGLLPRLYQCHCSLCRKVSGSASNSAMLVQSDQFEWRSGETLISRFKRDSGFKSHFCKRCGSPMPNAFDGGMWVPAGLLEQNDQLKVAAHLYVQSKATWHEIKSSAKQYTYMPDKPLVDLLQAKNKATD